MALYKYNALVYKNGGLEEQVIETDEDYDRVIKHAHIHSAVPVAEVKVEAKEEAKVVVKTRKPKK